MHVARMETGVYSRCGNLRNLTNDDRSHKTDNKNIRANFYKDSQGFPVFFLGGLLFLGTYIFEFRKNKKRRELRHEIDVERDNS